MTELSIGQRLLWFATRVRKGVLFADIGTDHAKLPIYLVKRGIISHAVASDIGEGPIAHARINIGINGLCNQISTFVGDGIAHLNICPPADIAICGMGGETIIGIIEGAPFLKNQDIRLLLQPMTDFAEARRYLGRVGFDIIDEDIVLSDGKMYQCIIACYSGNVRTFSDSEAELGVLNISKKSETFLEYVKARRSATKTRFDGKTKAGLDTSSERALLLDYEEILNG